jgi:hypothetical protein
MSQIESPPQSHNRQFRALARPYSADRDEV